MKIKRSLSKTYRYELKLDKKEEYDSCSFFRFDVCDSGSINIYGDAGVYSHSWDYDEITDFLCSTSNISKEYFACKFAFGPDDFIRFLCSIDKEYLLSKIATKNVFGLEESKQQTIEMLENNYEAFGIKSEAELEAIKQKILDISVVCSPSYVRKVAADIVPDIRWDDVPTVAVYPWGAEVVADIFEKYIQPKLMSEFDE